MKIRIVGHPRDRMSERGISVQDVEHALRNHHTSYDDERKNSVTYVGPGLSGEDLKVWVLPPGLTGEDSTITVKSVAWKDR